MWQRLIVGRGRKSRVITRVSTELIIQRAGRNGVVLYVSAVMRLFGILRTTDMKEIHDVCTCQCNDCMKVRLVYALVVARNMRDITNKDLEVGLLILTTMLSEESL